MDLVEKFGLPSDYQQSEVNRACFEQLRRFTVREILHDVMTRSLVEHLADACKAYNSVIDDHPLRTANAGERLIEGALLWNLISCTLELKRHADYRDNMEKLERRTRANAVWRMWS